MKSAMLFFALAGSVGAQVPTGMISGVIRDPSGAAIAGASVRVVNLATNLARAEANSEQGPGAMTSHEFGLKLAVEERQALIAFLKTL